MKAEKFLDLFQRKVNYIFENPYYNKIDKILMDIADDLFSILSDNERIKYEEQLNSIINDMKDVKIKRITREKKKKEILERLKDFVEDYKELEDIFLKD